MLRTIAGYAVTVARPLSLALAVALAPALLMPASDEAYAPPRAERAASCVPKERFAVPAPDPAETLLAKYLSRRFLIAAQAAERMVGASYRAAREVGLDPLVVLAVISVESRFNPIAESVMGAKGLMQIIPRYHREKLADQGGEAALWDPETNILVGARILQEYVYRTGTLEAGLQYYNGAFSDSTAQYAQKVLAERERLLDVLGHGHGATTLAMRGG
jgi:soluble lytic murein transglycosylase-like protein